MIGAHLLVAFLLLPCWAQAEDLSGWPRMDVLELTAPTRALVNDLAQDDFIIDAEDATTVRVYATVERRAELDRRGIAYTQVGQQPDPPVFGTKAALGEYHSYAAVTDALNTYAAAYPAITRLISLGKSVEGRELWGLHITDNPDSDEDEPEFYYISTMHGDEPVGTEMLLYLIDLLLSSYGTESVQGARLTGLVNNLDIWILPLVNPDGLTAGTRYNKNGVDLNRNFPSYVVDASGDGNIFDGDILDTAGRQVEDQAMMTWSAARSFTLSANMHTGALVVNYPFDEGDGLVDSPAICPDDALFINVSLRYSIHNAPMYGSPQFEDGITNGRAWYTLNGGLQDWSYRYLSNNHVTIELSNVTKKPAQSTLPTFWNNNRESMLSYMESAQIGVRGIVTDACSGAAVYAKVNVAGNIQPVYTDPDVGDYHRMLLPGTYTLTVNAEGYEPQTINDVVVGSGDAVRRDVLLVPLEGCDTIEGQSDGEGAANTVDQNGNGAFELSELLRVIQLYGAYRFKCDATTEDGYAPYGGVCLGCAAYSSDYKPRDCVISLSELLRAVQIFNAGGYTVCPGNDEGDGYCPLPIVR